MRIRTANKRRKRKEWHSTPSRLLLHLDAGKILDFMRAEYIRVGYLYSGSVGIQFLSARLGLSWDAANTAVELLLARRIIRTRRCLSRSLELTPSERLSIIEKHDLATDWQDRAACFYPLDDQVGEIPRVKREVQTRPQSRHNRSRRLKQLTANYATRSRTNLPVYSCHHYC